MGHIYGYV
jgi:hypothetical protein